jgi:hypothetical protein
VHLARRRWLIVALGVLGVVLSVLPAAAAPAAQEAVPATEAADAGAPGAAPWDWKTFEPTGDWCPDWGQVAGGTGGEVWYAGGCGVIGRIADDGRLDTVRVPGAGPTTLLTDLAAAPNGDLWVTDGDHALYRITPEMAITKIPLRNQFAWKVTTLEDGSVWVNAGNDHGDQLLRFDAAGRITRIIATPIAETTIDLAAGPDGRLWVLGSEGYEGVVVAIDPNHPQQQERFALGLPAESNGALVAGPDGNIWFSLWAPGTLGSITPEGRVTVRDTPADFVVNRLAVGGPGDCGIWVTDYGTPGRIARVDPVGRSIRYLTDPDLANASIGGSPTSRGIWFANGEHYGYLDPGVPGSC